MIKKLDYSMLHDAGGLELVWRVFEEFEAPEYTPEGVEEFKNFITPEQIEQMMLDNSLLFWGYFKGKVLAGIIAVRPPGHISLLFVEKEYHYTGIARSLYKEVREFYLSQGEVREITVNSSPYAVGAYRKLGFVETNTEQTVNGIRFIPMKHQIGKTN